MKILCEISTKGRTNTTLPMTIQSIAFQTRKPDKVIIFDDNEPYIDILNSPMFKYSIDLLEQKGIEWFVAYGQHKGQHYSHQSANEYAFNNEFDFVWRIDDDEIAEPNCLELLISNVSDDVVAVAPCVIYPSNKEGLVSHASSRLVDIFDRPNIQWYKQDKRIIEAEHLYSSFIYRPGLAEYNLALSNVAHREETLFTIELNKHGKLLINTESIIWHLRNPEGGIRQNTTPELWWHDDQIFRKIISLKRNVFILNEGLGDHIVFRKLLDDNNIEDYTIFGCYPELFKNMRSISEAVEIFGNIDKFSLYKWMDKNNWKGDLYSAYKKMYNL